jgi:hypothetical protein
MPGKILTEEDLARFSASACAARYALGAPGSYGTAHSRSRPNCGLGNGWSKHGDNLFRHNDSTLWFPYIDGSVLFRWYHASVPEVEKMLQSLKSLPKPKPVSVPPPGM